MPLSIYRSLHWRESYQDLPEGLRVKQNSWPLSWISDGMGFQDAPSWGVCSVWEKKGALGGLPVQKTWVPSLIKKDPTCHRATEPTRHNYWACALEPGAATTEAHVTYSRCSATEEATAMGSLRNATRESPPLAAIREKSPSKEDPVHPNKYIKEFFFWPYILFIYFFKFYFIF